MEIFTHIPSVIRILIIFAAILIAMKAKLHMSIAFLIGVAVLIIMFAIPLPAALVMIFKAIIGGKTLSLAFLLLFIMLLSEGMALTGQMNRMLTAFQGLVKSPFINLAVFPMLTGLLPMVGGAVLSAPMVKEMANKVEIEPAQLSYINYWYRHVWEFWWPMYPGFLMAVSLINMPVTRLMLLMFPLAIVIIASGYLPARKFMPQSLGNTERKPRALRRFLLEAYPLFAVIAVGMIAGAAAAKLFPQWLVAREVCLIVALFFGTLWVLKRGHVPKDKALGLLKNKRLYSMVYVVFAIMIFQGVLVGSNAAEILAADLEALQAPPVIVCIVLPFILASLTGITMAYVGASFPIIISMVMLMGQAHLLPAYIVLALAAGQCGLILSPTHACLVLSNQYFCTTHTKVYRYLVPPTALLFVMSLIYFVILKGYYS